MFTNDYLTYIADQISDCITSIGDLECQWQIIEDVTENTHVYEMRIAPKPEKQKTVDDFVDIDIDELAISYNPLEVNVLEVLKVFPSEYLAYVSFENTFDDIDAGPRLVIEYNLGPEQDSLLINIFQYPISDPDDEGEFDFTFGLEK